MLMDKAHPDKLWKPILSNPRKLGPLIRLGFDIPFNDINEMPREY